MRTQQAVGARGMSDTGFLSFPSTAERNAVEVMDRWLAAAETRQTHQVTRQPWPLLSSLTVNEAGQAGCKKQCS